MNERKENLFEEFKHISKEDWAKKATADLKNEDVFKKFSHALEEGIVVDPYYDKSDLKNIEYLSTFQNRQLKKTNPTGEIRYWENLQKIIVHSTISANSDALEALNHGADGIIFDIRHIDDISFSELLNNILVDYCSLSLMLGRNFTRHLAAFDEFVSDKNIDPLALKGLIILDDETGSEENYLEVFRGLINYPELRTLSLHHHSALETSDAIASLLLHAVSHIERMDEAGFDIEQSVSNLVVRTTISTQYFEEIAKIRVIRKLFFQLARAYGMESFDPEDLHIHCISPAWTDEKYQPHGNMLKSTTAAMSAILGGGDSLLIEPEDDNSPFMLRIARNVSNVLKEESYFNKTADPAAGAYYIEVLTDKLAQKAWRLFQQKVSIKKKEAQQ